VLPNLVIIYQVTDFVRTLISFSLWYLWSFRLML